MKKIKSLLIIEPKIKGFFIRDDVAKTDIVQIPQSLIVDYWTRKEIENYLIIPELLIRYIQENENNQGLFADFKRIEIATNYLKDNLPPKVYNNPLENSISEKGSDFLTDFFNAIKLNLNKGEYWKIADHMTKDEIHPDIINVLEKLYDVIPYKSEIKE